MMALSAVQGSAQSSAPGPVTPLYGLLPQDVGLGQIESLPSYLYGLANAHSFPITALIHRVIPTLAKLHEVKSPRALTAWEKSPSSSLAVSPGFALNLAECLVALTGRSEVRRTVLAPALKFVTGQQLQSHALRVCPRCLLDDEERGELPYCRLLWTLRSVTCCSIHGTVLVEAKCGDVKSTKRAFHSSRMRSGGSCGSCGSNAFRCLTVTEVTAGELELWKAHQIAEAVEQWVNLQEESLVRLKRELRIYCAERDGCEQLAVRCGLTKSTLSRWLNLPAARLSLAAMLDLCASEGFTLAKLLVADLTRTTWPAAVAPSRLKRRVVRLDRRRLEAALDEAIAKGKQVGDVAVEEGVNRSSLERIGALYEKLRDQNARERRSKRTLRIKAAVADAETVLRKLMQAGKVPSTRNAGLQTEQVWAVSQARCVALICLRMKLGDVSVSMPNRSIALNPQFQDEVVRAAERLRGELLNYKTVQSGPTTVSTLDAMKGDEVIAA